MKVFTAFFSLCLGGLNLLAGAVNNSPANVVIVITDDQGYGDLGCTGNPVIQTPHLDRLANESIWLTDYHVAPTCSPTRAALMSGHWTNRTGAWHTIMGRSMLREDEGTLGEFFKGTGYQTGMFGKWHLGDNFPYRPEDRGFNEVYRHGGGGVGQTPDVWDNAYFDGGYFHNGKIVDAKGFCTDVFFQEGNRFIRESVKQKKPFLAYISTNAPHGPFHCPQKYLDMYKGQPGRIASFFGMIAQIDDQFGRILQALDDTGQRDNTVIIFTSDHGESLGDHGLMYKGCRFYEGLVRVPLIFSWPSNFVQNQKSDALVEMMDLSATLLEVAGIPLPDYFQGKSLLPILSGSSKGTEHRQFVRSEYFDALDPHFTGGDGTYATMYRTKSHKLCVYHGKGVGELFDMKKDPLEKTPLPKDSKKRQRAELQAVLDEMTAP